MIQALKCGPIRCGDCGRPVATLLPDGSLQIEARHGGQTHYAYISLETIIKQVGKKRVEEVMRGI